MYRFNQHSFVGGQLDRGLMGRQDLERYFQGASKLENFIVRKQGNITKRRGTEMMADLGDLFGTGESVAYSRILPFSYEISGGYYLLLAESSGDTPKRGAFIISDTGMQHKWVITKTKLDSQGVETEETETLEGYEHYRTTVYTTENSEEIREIKNDEGVVTATETWKVVAVTTPAIIDIPYSGNEFSSIGYNQSGDTLFIVHKNHPPAKVVNNHQNFSYSTLDFSFKKWFPPRIVSITPSGTWGTTSSTKTVSYVATYVKDGIESEPSAEFQYSYQLPWGNTCRLEITVDNGNNIDDPDYFNIYKKESTEFGIVSTTSTNSPVFAYPSSTPLSRYKGNNTTDKISTSDISSILNRSEYSGETLDGVINSSRVDAALWGSAVTLDFGSNYGKVITDISLLLDFITIVKLWRQGHGFGHIITLGITSQRLKITMGYGEVGSTTTKTVSKSIDSPAPASIDIGGLPEWGGGEKSLKPGINEFNIMGESPYVEYTARLARRVSVAFKDLLTNAGYSDGANTSSTTNKKIETRYIKIEAFTDSTEKTAGYLCFQGISFESSWGVKKVFQDDYITPNLAHTPPQIIPHFDDAKSYPSCVAMYTQRLAFAATQSQPFTWWMSCVGDLYNFNTHASIRQDDAMEVTVPATEFPNINHMVLSRDLVLFCDNGEWLVRPLTGNTLAYDTVECKKQSAIGCAKSVPPLQVGDEIIFADNSKRVVRSIKYQFTSDGYESNDLSILSQSLFFTNPVISMCYKQHPESLILCELSDGTVAALVYMKEHNVVAWTHHTLGGGWKCRGIASNKAHAEETTHVAMLVENDDGGVEVWRIRDDDESSNLADQLCMDGLRFALGSEIGAAAFENGQAVVDLGNGQFLNSTAELVAEKEYAVGYPFTSTFVSVRPEPQGAETFQWELKNAKKVHIRTLNGSSFTVKEAGMADDYASKVEIERSIEGGTITTPGLIDATDILLNGENSRDGRIEIKHDGILPLTIESFSVDYETQPLYQSEG